MQAEARARWAAERPGSGHPVEAACVAPWVSLEFDPQGFVYTCCANQLYPLGRIGDERLSDLWGGGRARVLRDSLQRWDLSNGCGSCRWHIEHGRTDTDAAVYDRYQFTGPDPASPAAMTFALSNRCNLGCVMCNGELSSTLRHQAGLPPIVSRYDDQFFEDLKPLLGSLQYAKFLGGEPFLIPEHHRVWQMMDELDDPPRMQVTTNGTVWTERVEWLINRFDVDITVSIDAATQEVYERIRRGARHAEVMRNVARFHERCRAAGTGLGFCFCLMSDNWNELPAFLRWADSLDVRVSVNVVSDDGMAFHDLPDTVLDGVAAQWGSNAPEKFGLNAEVWEVQLRQLDAVRSERRRGLPRSLRQAQPSPSGVLAVGTKSNTTAQDSRRAKTEEWSRLMAWSGGGPVGEFRVTNGRVTAVDAEHPLLGINHRWVGLDAGELVERISQADGRRAWLLGDDVVDDTLVRTFVLSTEQPARGAAGTIVRTVSIGTGSDDEWITLVAVDLIHERSAPTSVDLPQRLSYPRQP